MLERKFRIVIHSLKCTFYTCSCGRCGLAFWPTSIVSFGKRKIFRDFSNFFQAASVWLELVPVFQRYRELFNFQLYDSVYKEGFPSTQSHPYSLQLCMIERETSKTFSKSRWFIWNSAFVVGYVQPQFHWILAPKMMTQSKALKRHTSSIHALKINPIPQIFLITIRLTPQGHWIWWLSRLYYGGWLTKAIQFWRSRRRIGNQNWSEWGLWDTTFPAATALNMAWL